MATWTCTDCETVNGPNDAHCLVCMSSRTEAERRHRAASAEARVSPGAAEPMVRSGTAASRGGRRRAGLVAALCLVLVLGAVAVVVAATGSGGGDTDSPLSAAPASTGVESPATGAGTTSPDGEEPVPAESPAPIVYDRGAYTLELPASWQPAERSVPHEGYVESRWHPSGHPEVTVLVDHTGGTHVDAETAAESVRAQVVGYAEHGWAPARLGDEPAWRWDFDVGGKRKIDWFANACHTGYALLASAPPWAFARYQARFERIADSLRPSCT